MDLLERVCYRIYRPLQLYSGNASGCCQVRQLVPLEGSGHTAAEGRSCQQRRLERLAAAGGDGLQKLSKGGLNFKASKKAPKRLEAPSLQVRALTEAAAT